MCTALSDQWTPLVVTLRRSNKKSQFITDAAASSCLCFIPVAAVMSKKKQKVTPELKSDDSKKLVYGRPLPPPPQSKPPSRPQTEKPSPARSMTSAQLESPKVKLDDKSYRSSSASVLNPAGSAEKLSASQYRKKIVDEILDTENSYITSLNVMIEKYLNPLRTNLKFAKEPYLDIFGNVEDIYKTNQVLFESLKVKTADWQEDTQIGDSFIEEGSFLKPHYMLYTQNYQNAQNALAQCEKNPAFAQFLKETHESTGENLRSLQIKPIQRITRYTLLLGDLVRRTPPDHKDFESLNTSLDKMLQTARGVNEVVKAGENRQKILNIQNQFLGRMNLLEAHRIFVREGQLMKVCRKSTKSRWFILFNDIIIHASLTSIGKFMSHQIWKLSDIRTEDIANRDPTGTAFQIVTASKSFVVYALSKQEKIEWLHDINQAIDDYVKKRATFGDRPLHEGDRIEAPVWQQDNEVSRCTLCNTEFSFLKRRHHCRACGRLACDPCSSNRCVLKNVGISPVRVCDVCYEQVTQLSSSGVNP
ncbi:hypothetical protein PROFUN_02053 [Planoprotostelium fungivorum]|uniref:Uncharacterized protein n=1 Tax=Planoprotostelium fungivorum TaxID=1890364 RepID=A0A2P6NB97_9EUKA|nr:hypothetical protein PROFUN_02053 [Planoprotostelium fungivorum]